MNNYPDRQSARYPSQQRGFTLIEIMVVVVIIALLGALIVPNVMGRVDQAKITKVKNDVMALESALNMYRLDNGRYPTTDQGLEALIQKPEGGQEARNWKQGGYLTKRAIPKDPWGYDYLYLSPGENGEIDIFSYGADGTSGGEGMNADIGNWEVN